MSLGIIAIVVMVGLISECFRDPTLESPVCKRPRLGVSR